MFNEMSKDELLEHYSKKMPGDFIQYDGHCDLPADDHIEVDETGHSFFTRHTRELMDGATVRVLIRLGTPKDTALQLLSKITEWVSEDAMYEYLNTLKQDNRAGRTDAA